MRTPIEQHCLSVDALEEAEMQQVCEEVLRGGLCVQVQVLAELVAHVRERDHLVWMPAVRILVILLRLAGDK